MKRLWMFALLLLVVAAGCAGADTETAATGTQSGARVTVYSTPT